MTAVTSNYSAAGAPFRAGAALSRAFSVFRAQWVKFFVLTAIPLAPTLALDLAIGERQSGSFAALRLFGLLLQMVLGALANATCLYGAYQVMRGQTFSVGGSLNAASGRLASVVGASLLGGLLTGLAMILLIVPGLIVMCAIYVALPACVVERLGPVQCLRRSRALTSGYRWPIFGLIVAVGIASAVAAGGAGAAAGVTRNLVVITVVIFAASVLIGAFGAVLSAVIYHDLRVAKEGVDIDKLANVFD